MPITAQNAPTKIAVIPVIENPPEMVASPRAAIRAANLIRRA
jgi:hypothetical protein